MPYEKLARLSLVESEKTRERRGAGSAYGDPRGGAHIKKTMFQRDSRQRGKSCSQFAQQGIRRWTVKAARIDSGEKRISPTTSSAERGEEEQKAQIGEDMPYPGKTNK